MFGLNKKEEEKPQEGAAIAIPAAGNTEPVLSPEVDPSVLGTDPAPIPADGEAAKEGSPDTAPSEPASDSSSTENLSAASGETPKEADAQTPVVPATEAAAPELSNTAEIVEKNLAGSVADGVAHDPEA